jgi:hypothetical protein
MKERRVRDARQKLDVHNECVTAWIRNDETIDAEVGGLMVSEFMLMIRHALTK